MIRQASRSYLFLALLLTVPALLPLIAPGYFFGAHDGRHTVFFLVEFDQAFRDGALWPVWSPGQAAGFGYPLWLLYAPLAYFAAEGFHLLGLGYTAAVKVTWAFFFLFGAGGAFLLARRWWGRAGALVAAVAYTYAPYHLVQIYVRAALAEFAALAWLPWVLLAFVVLWDNPRPRNAALAALALGALLLSHTVSALIFLPFLAGYLLLRLVQFWRGRDGARTGVLGSPILWTGVALGVGALVASIFLLPMLFERSYVVEAQWVHNTYDYRYHFVYPSQFFDPKWGYGYSVPGPDDAMSFQLGPLIVFAGAVGALAALSRKEGGLPHRAEILGLLLASMIALIAMTPAAKPLWDVLPLVGLVQFPWRVLALLVLTLALLAGAGTHWLELQLIGSGEGGPYPFVLAMALVLASYPFVQPQLRAVGPQDESPSAAIQFEVEYPDMRGMTRWADRLPRNEDSPLIEQYLSGAPLHKASLVEGSGEIIEEQYSANTARVRVRSGTPAVLQLYTYYFPGWRAEVDGNAVEITPRGPNGLISLPLPPGERDVVVHFGPTLLRLVGTVASLFGILAVVLLFVLDSRVAKSG